MSSSDTDYPVWYYIEAGTTQGPVPAHVVRSLVASGRLGPVDQVRHVGWKNWWQVHDAAEALGLEPPAPPPPPQPAPQPQTAPRPQTEVPITAVSIVPVPAASRFGRTIAWIIDLVVLVLLLGVSNLMIEYTPLASLVAVSSILVYLVVLPAAGFMRLGHLVAGLRIVDAETFRAPNSQALAARGLVVLMLALPMLVLAFGSVFNVYLSRQRVAWHDAVTGTLVVKRR